MTLRELVLGCEYYVHCNNHNSKILYYHDINDDKLHKAYARDATSLDLFKQHLDVVKKCGFSIVNKITRPECEVAISLDDGWAGILDVRDYLYENNIYPSISIAPGLLNLSGYLSDNDVKTLHKEGCPIICHTWTHQSITLYNNSHKALDRELGDSRKYLEDLLSDEIDTICYPQGRFSKKTYESTIEYGYKEIWTCVDGNYFDDLFPLTKRRNLAQHISKNELKWVLMGPNKIKANRHYNMLYSNE